MPLDAPVTIALAYGNDRMLLNLAAMVNASHLRTQFIADLVPIHRWLM
jgi:hypothetical protein